MPVTTADVEIALRKPLRSFARQCHAASIALVRSDLFPVSRVARGGCLGVIGQHSWVVVGEDVYAPDAQIVDPTLWSYDSTVTGVWNGSAADGRHIPHGSGSIFRDYGKPTSSGGPTIDLTPATPLSAAARQFLTMLGPLDRRGWHALLHAPVGEWPAAEIIAACADTKALSVMIPVDILGMLTDRNPMGMYLRTPEIEDAS